MIELIFAIVIVAILVGIALPKLTVTRDDAIVTRGKATLASVRNAIAVERQRRLLFGDMTDITDLANGESGKIFSKFNPDSKNDIRDVLSYPLKQGSDVGQWQKEGMHYTFYYSGGSCGFLLENNKLVGECEVFGD
jgi:general secretion pathway protein G